MRGTQSCTNRKKKPTNRKFVDKVNLRPIQSTVNRFIGIAVSNINSLIERKE